MARPKKISSTEYAQALKDKAQMLGIPAEELSKLLLLAEVMKQPTALEQQKVDDEVEYARTQLMETAKIENQRIANREQYQKFCTHRHKQTGRLTIAGQVIGPDHLRVAFVQCNDPFCKKTWMWKAMEEEKTNGLCLNDDSVSPRFQDASQLDYQEKALPIPPDFARIVGHPEVALRHESYQPQAVAV